MGQQSEEEGGQHTSLGGPCVQCDGAGCVTADPYCLRSPGQKVQQPVAQRRIEPQLDQLWMSCWEMMCWMLNWSLWTAIWHTIFFVQMCEGWVEGSGDGIIGRAVGPICKLEGVQGGGRTDLMCCMTSRSKHFMRIEWVLLDGRHWSRMEMTSSGLEWWW